MARCDASSMQKSQLVNEIENAVQTLLPDGYPSVCRVAARLGISVRTLQRRLHESGLTYSSLVQTVRHREACRRLLRSQQSISDIGKALGYTDPSHFSRAFRRWADMSPRSFRTRAGRAIHRGTSLARNGRTPGA